VSDAAIELGRRNERTRADRELPVASAITRFVIGATVLTLAATALPIYARPMVQAFGGLPFGIVLASAALGALP
jgi:ABC-type methionine transport system permease subunit